MRNWTLQVRRGKDPYPDRIDFDDRRLSTSALQIRRYTYAIPSGVVRMNITDLHYHLRTVQRPRPKFKAARWQRNFLGTYTSNTMNLPPRFLLDPTPTSSTHDMHDMRPSLSIIESFAF